MENNEVKPADLRQIAIQNLYTMQRIEKTIRNFQVQLNDSMEKIEYRLSRIDKAIRKKSKNAPNNNTISKAASSLAAATG